MFNPRPLLHPALLGITASALVAGNCLAHEFWVSPSTYRPDRDELVQVSLFHGERFAGDPVARNHEKIKRFEYRAGGSVTEVRGMHGSTASFLRPTTDGLGVIVYETEEYINVLPAERFEAYLAEEGLDEISVRRAELGETDAEGREAYVRCAKSLMAVGDSAGATLNESEPVGLPYEIVLTSDGATTDGQVVATILFAGEPIAGRQMVAVAEDYHDHLIELVSDTDGTVRFVPDRGGAWMLTSLHMVRETDREDIDWKSYWASMSFSLPGGAGPANTESASAG